MPRFRPAFLILPLALIALVPWVGSLISTEDTENVFSGKVVAVKDGDSIEVLRNGKAVRIRLAHIDCPEGGQPFGKAAKQFTSDLCHGRMATVEVDGRPDRYGRLISTITVEGVNVNKALVQEGLAWHYKHHSKDSVYAALEESARAAGLGLWADPHAEAPWNWRKNKRKKKEPELAD